MEYDSPENTAPAERSPEGIEVARGAVSSLEEAWHKLTRIARDNPVPVALVGGVLAAFVAVRQGDARSARQRGRTASDHLAELLRLASNRSDWLMSASERAGEMGTQALDRARGLAGQASGTGLATARGSLETLVTEHPILAGAASFALGAVLGGARSVSRGDTAERRTA